MSKLSSHKLEAFTDLELISRYKTSKEGELIGVLFKRYTHLVYGVCLKYLKNREESQDAVMQIFEKLFTALLDHEVNHFPGWLHVLSRNHCLMKLRKNKKEGFDVSFEDYHSEFMESDNDWHPLFEKQASDEIETLTKCLKKLDEKQKECIELFFFKKQSYKQISLSLGYELKKVKSYIQNGKRSLGICIKQNRE